VLLYHRECPTDFIRKACFSKGQHWDYESEYRILLDQSGLAEFSPTSIKEIILGCRAFSPLRSHVRGALDALHDSGIVVSQAIEKHAEFGLSKEPIEKNKWTMTSFF
jgi:hypothetical protein